MIDLISAFFNTFLINPLTNLFILLATLTGSAGIAVILLTMIIRLATFPLYLKQMHSTRMMAALGPRIQELNKRYSDPKRRSEEQMKLYREAGINPLGCLSGMLLQMPILAALYRTFRLAVGETPEALIDLSHHLYGWNYLRNSVPLPAHFLWLDLGQPDPLLLPILVAASTYALQKMTMMPATDEKQRAQNQMMNLMMPLMFAWFTITLPSGLALYYVLSNVVGMVMQYIYIGGGAFNWRALVGLSQEPVLPRALIIRQKQLDSMSQVGRDNQESDDAAAPAAKPKASPPDGNGTAAARRRRYTSGRRRGRR